MKIVMLHGQNHKGSTYHMSHLLLNQLKDEHEVTEFFFPKDLNHFCMGCYQCIEDESRCPFYEEKHKILTEIEAADILIYTTPVYCMHVSAPMKSFIDLTFTYWMPHKPREIMFSKRAVILSTAAGSGMKSAIKDIKTCLTYWGISNIVTYGTAVAAMHWDQVSDKKKDAMNKKMQKIAHRLERRQKSGTSLKIKAIFYLMRFMQLKGWGSSKEEELYWEKKGWLGSKRPWKEGESV